MQAEFVPSAGRGIQSKIREMGDEGRSGEESWNLWFERKSGWDFDRKLKLKVVLGERTRRMALFTKTTTCALD